MEPTSTQYQKGILSPEPKRITFALSPSRILNISRSKSCKIPDSVLVSELSEILSQNIEPMGTNLSQLFMKFSNMPPERDQTNPIISDEKFILLEQTLSTSEDSGSDSDRFVSIFNSL